MTTPRTEWPSTPVPEPTKDLIIKFFAIGDEKSDDAAQRLGDEVFTPTGQIIVNKNTIDGAAAIASSNHGFLEGMETRRHEIFKVYSCNDVADDLMLVGNVTWGLKNGQVLSSGFCARALIDNGDWKTPRLKLYQGWIDMSELQMALKQL